MSGIRPPDCSKLAKNPKNDNDVTIFRHDVNVNFFWRCFVSLVKFSYWSKFYVNIMTDSGIMTIFFYKGLARNPEIGNTHVWVFPNIWRLEQVMDTNFGTNVSNRMLLNVAKFQGYSFYRFWVIKGKPTGGGVKSHFSGIIRFSSRSRLNWNTSKEKVTVHVSISTIDFFRFSSVQQCYSIEEALKYFLREFSENFCIITIIITVIAISSKWNDIEIFRKFSFHNTSNK